MISVNDFRTGLTIIVDGQLYRVMDFQHVKPGKGAAFVRSKLRNLRNGNVQEKKLSALVRKLKKHKLIIVKCSIYMHKVTSMSSWIWSLMTKQN